MKKIILLPSWNELKVGKLPVDATQVKTGF